MNTETESYLLAALWTADPSPGQGDYEAQGLTQLRRVA